jgi:hypothetical protein
VKPVARNYVPQGGVPYKVRDGESWITIARKHNTDPWALIRFNYPGLPSRNELAAPEVNWYLQEYVGCRQLTSDRTNYMFTSSASPGIIYVPSGTPEPLECRPVEPDYSRFHTVIDFMYREMYHNARSKQVEEIRAMWSGERAAETFTMSGEPGERAAQAGAVISDSLLAATRWKNLVKAGAVWDHKGRLRDMLGVDPNTCGDLHFPIEGDPDHEYYYDIWSNIHYGYVGRAAGFPGSILQWGAARGGAAGRNDPLDVETVQIGIDLWDRHGLNLTRGELHQAILSRRQRMLQLQQTPEYRSTSNGFQHILPMTDGY